MSRKMSQGAENIRSLAELLLLCKCARKSCQNPEDVSWVLSQKHSQQSPSSNQEEKSQLNLINSTSVLDSLTY